MTVIDLKEFEHFFESTILKRGLQLYKNDKVFFVNKNSNGLYNYYNK